MRNNKFRKTKKIAAVMICAVLVWGCKGQAQTGSLNEGEAQTGSPTEGEAQTGFPTKGEAQIGSLATEHAETMAGTGRDGEAGAGFSGMEDTWAGYSDDQLLDMAQAYYLQKEGSRPGHAQIEDMPDTYSRVHIWLYDMVDEGEESAHGATRCNYYVNRHTAQGTDTNFNPVDLTDVLTGKEPVPEDFYSLATDLPASQVEEFAKKVKQQMLLQDWDALAGELAYPVTIDGASYDTPEEFLAADFGTGLNPYFFVELEEETCSRMFCNWSGIMLGETGRVWVAEALNDDLSSQGLKVRAINGLNESFGLPGGVSMYADESDITPASMKLSLENETDLDIVFEEGFRLQKYDGESWVDMEPLVKNDEIYPSCTAYKPRRGHPEEWTVDLEYLYGGLEEGTYAITKSVKDVNGTGGYTDSERTFSFTINP